MSEIEAEIASFETRETVHGVIFHASNPRFRTLFPEGSRATIVASGFVNTEGPVWYDDRLLFVDPARNRIISYRPLVEGPEITTFRYPSGYPLDLKPSLAQCGAMGLTVDGDGRLIACESGNRRVSRTEHNGDIVTLADSFEGRRLNRPNDVIVARDGAVYFTDPIYKLPTEREEVENPASVYKLSADGLLTRLSSAIGFPNGLALSPDEACLYVADSDNHDIKVIDLVSDCGEPKHSCVVFSEMKSSSAGVPDGIKVDVDGNVYCGGGGGLWVFGQSGETLGMVEFPDWPRNLAWGDRDGRTLYITAGTTVYRIRTATAGSPQPFIRRAV